MDESLGIVVPAYRPDVDRLSGYVRELVDRLSPAVVRIELDAPGAGVAETLTGLPDVEVAVAERRRGKGAAITAGFEALDAGRLAFVDADGSTPVGSVAAVVTRLESADVAVGSRRHPDAVVHGHQTFARRRLGDAFAWLARRLLPVDLHDYQCGAKALTAGAWRRVRRHLYEPGFAWDVELVAMASALGLRVAEVPIEWEDQPGSTVDPLATALDLGVALVTARHRAKRLQDSRLHGAIAARRDETALVDRRADGGGHDRGPGGRRSR